MGKLDLQLSLKLEHLMHFKGLCVPVKSTILSLNPHLCPVFFLLLACTHTQLSPAIKPL